MQPTIELVAHVSGNSGIFYLILSPLIYKFELFKTVGALRYVFFLVLQHVAVNFF